MISIRCFDIVPEISLNTICRSWLAGEPIVCSQIAVGIRPIRQQAGSLYLDFVFSEGKVLD